MLTFFGFSVEHIAYTFGASKAECLHFLNSQIKHIAYTFCFAFPSTLPTLTVFHGLLMSSFAFVLKQDTHIFLIFLITQVRCSLHSQVKKRKKKKKKTLPTSFVHGVQGDFSKFLLVRDKKIPQTTTKNKAVLCTKALLDS